MPQLDKFTFVPQIFWLVVIFFFMYFILAEYSLPRLFKVLYFRQKKLLDLNKGSTLFCRESFFFQQNTDSLLTQLISRIKSLPEVTSKIVETEVSASTYNAAQVNSSLRRMLSQLSGYRTIKNSLDFYSIVRSTFKSNKSL
jgi:hypothetical protein